MNQRTRELNGLEVCEQGRVSHGGEQSEAWPAHRPPFMNLKLMKLHKTSFTISSGSSRERVKLNASRDKMFVERPRFEVVVQVAEKAARGLCVCCVLAIMNESVGVSSAAHSSVGGP